MKELDRLVRIEVQEGGKMVEEILVDPTECDIAQFSVRNPKSKTKPWIYSPDIEEVFQGSGREDLADRSLSDAHTLTIIKVDGSKDEAAIFEDFLNPGETAVINFL